MEKVGGPRCLFNQFPVYVPSYMYIKELFQFPSRELLISLVLYGNWKIQKAQRSVLLEKKKKEKIGNLGSRDEAHCQCAACSERSYRSVKDSMEERKK